MSRESLGHVKLEWTCPKCETRNPGPEKTCLSCGAPQPEDVQFEQASTQELIKDEAEIEKAKAGADVHCGFCGARNPAGSTECTQCGADLVHGTKRETGRVVGAYKTGPVKEVPCPNCGTNNPETVMRCSNCGAPTKKVEKPKPTPSAKTAPRMNPILLAVIGVIVVLCICVGVVFVALSMRTEADNGVVQGVHWVTMVDIEELRPVTYETWQDEVPSDGTLGVCRMQVHHVQDDPAPNSNKVCGTPFTVDTGGGFAEVVQDCQYEVLEEYCQYTLLEWQGVDQARLEGSDYSPLWPQPQIIGDQRLGDQQATYTVIFQTNDGQHTYTISSLDEYQRYQIGSEWVLNINTFGGVVSVEPAR